MGKIILKYNGEIIIQKQVKSSSHAEKIKKDWQLMYPKKFKFCEVEIEYDMVSKLPKSNFKKGSIIKNKEFASVRRSVTGLKTVLMNEY